jgi:hypothetical protein
MFNSNWIFICRSCGGRAENTSQKVLQRQIAVFGDISAGKQGRLTNTSEETGAGHKF